MRVDNWALAPMYVLAATLALTTIVLIADRRRLAVAATALGVAGAAGVALIYGFEVRGGVCTPQTCAYVATAATAVATVVGAIAVLGTLVATPRPSGETALLLVVSLLGLVTIAGARDILTLVVGLETLTLPTYALVALARRPTSADGALTLFIASVTATAIGLFGAAMLFAAVGTLNLTAIPVAYAGLGTQLQPVAVTGVVLLLIVVAFKLAAVPAHGWAPAAYDGSGAPLAWYLASAAKLGGLLALGSVLAAAAPARQFLGPVLAVMAVSSAVGGAVMALRQERLLRLLGWSSVSQLGFAVAPLAVAGARFTEALTASFAFLLLYLVALAPVFAACRGVETLADLRSSRPAGAAVVTWVVSAAGLAGLPPGLAGFWAKLASFTGVVNGGGGLRWLVLAGLATAAVVAFAAYLRVVAAALAPGKSGGAPSWPAFAVAAISVVVGCFPAPFWRAADAVSSAVIG